MYQQFKNLILELNILLKNENYKQSYIYIIYILLNKYKIISFYKINLNKANKCIWKYLNKILIYKMKKFNIFLEFSMNQNISNQILKKKNYTLIRNFQNKIINLKSFFLKNNIFKQKLINKKFNRNWKLKTIKTLKSTKLLLWPLIIYVRPYYLIIKNIYYKNIYIFRENDFKKLNKIKLEIPNLSLTTYIIQKYTKHTNIKNQVYKNYYIFNNWKMNLLNYNNKYNRVFYKKMQNIYNILKKNNNLIFFKLYNLIIFWIIIKINYFNLYFNKMKNILWINSFFIYDYTNLNKFFHNKLNNINFNVYVKNCKLMYKQINHNIYRIFSKTKFFIIRDEIFDYINIIDYYKIKNYYKNQYFCNNSLVKDNRTLVNKNKF